MPFVSLFEKTKQRLPFVICKMFLFLSNLQGVGYAGQVWIGVKVTVISYSMTRTCSHQERIFNIPHGAEGPSRKQAF